MSTITAQNDVSFNETYKNLKFRNIGPFRGGRSVASTGVHNDPLTYYMGSTGGGLWKTQDAGTSWVNISDGFFETGSVGAVAVSKSDPNVIYVGMGEHPVRGVMTSHGDGIYKSTDAGKTWKHHGLLESRHIAEIVIHPQNSNIAYVAVQGAVHGDSDERGVYKTVDGGITWDKVLYVDEKSGASDISMDASNPRILYASFWDHRRTPWQVRSGGTGSGLYKSTDGGTTWDKLKNGLPREMGKTSIDVSPANSNIVYANIEAKGTKGGVYRSLDGGKNWTQTNSDRITVARAWYYIEIFADPNDENTVYVLNAPMLKSIDGGKTFKTISNPHGDQHHMWINPANSQNIILSNDGGACITFNGGDTWTSQENQPTAQFYRVITDAKFPYKVYAGQQDNSSLIISSRTSRSGIGWKDWTSGPGCESAFLAFDPDNPVEVFGTCIQGGITAMDMATGHQRDVMAYPIIGLGWTPSEMKYRFNWNAPLVASIQDPNVMYHAGNKVLMTTDRGVSWKEISPDLTRDDKSKQIDGGVPFTNEGAGGEVYNTIAYLELSQHNPKRIWTGSDCGMVFTTSDNGLNWENVTPKQLGEVLVNSIDVSPHKSDKVYIVGSNYRFNDFSPIIYRSNNNGKSWKRIDDGLPRDSWVRVVREDEKVEGLLYAGTENGLYISYDDGKTWESMQLNLPKCPITDLTFRDDDMILATSGRAFWILDDLSSIRANLSNQRYTSILNPKPTFRVLSGGGFRPGSTKGQNAPNGAIIDYYLPDQKDSITIVLEILDKDNRIVRSFSNKKSDDYVKYVGGPNAEKLLSANRGVNRFVWDLKTESMSGVENVFMLGGYGGAIVPPGKYKLKLMVDDELVESEIDLLPDPRIEAGPEAYEEQFKNIMELREAINEIHDKVAHSTKTKTKLERFIKDYSNHDEAIDLINMATEINGLINSWESELIQRDQKTFQDVINFPNKLNAEMANLMSTMNVSQPILTEGMRVRKKELLAQWAKSHKHFADTIVKEVELFNQAFSASGIGFITR